MLASCGGGGSNSRTGLAAACSRIPLPRVAALVRIAGGSPKGLRRGSGGSVRLTRCSFRGRGVNASLTLDAARRAVTRYSNRVVELLQFSSTNPALRPHPVSGIGDRGTPEYGANWVPANDELLSVRGRRALIATFYVRGAAPASLERGAIGLTRLAYAALGVKRKR